MIRRLRALWQQLVELGDPFAVDTDWHHDLDTDPHNASLPKEATP